MKEEGPVADIERRHERWLKTKAGKRYSRGRPPTKKSRAAYDRAFLIQQLSLSLGISLTMTRWMGEMQRREHHPRRY